jgi:hypothetical protein
MKPSSLLPPVGWIVALASAMAASFWTPTGNDNGDFGGQRSVPTEDSTTIATPADDLAMATATSIESAATLLGSRPLLAEGRRKHSVSPLPEVVPVPEPAPVAPEVATLPPPAPPVLSMLGTLEKDGTRSVLLRDEASGSENWYRPGEVILGWTIVEILPDRVRLQLQDAEIAFNLFQE